MNNAEKIKELVRKNNPNRFVGKISDLNEVKEEKINEKKDSPNFGIMK